MNIGKNLGEEEKRVVKSFFDQINEHWKMFTRLTEERFRVGLVRFNKKKNRPVQVH